MSDIDAADASDGIRPAALDGLSAADSPATRVARAAGRRRRRLTAAAVAVLALAAAGAATWYDLDVIRAQPLAWMGGLTAARGDGVSYQEDPFADPTNWYLIEYTPSSVVRAEFTLTNTGHFPLHITGMVFPAAPSPDDPSSPSLFQSATAYVQPNVLADDNDLLPFRPVTLPPNGQAMFAWDLQTCPASARTDKDENESETIMYDTFQMTYSYGGWSRTTDVPLVTRLAFHNPTTCGPSGP